MQKFNFTKIFIALLIFLTITSNAQYKLNIGNFWVYSGDNQEWKISIIDNTFLFDSVSYYETYEQREWIPKSNYYSQNNGDTNQYFIRQRDDDLFEEVIVYNAIEDTVIQPYSYKYNAQLGDKWIYRIAFYEDSTVVDTSWSEVVDVFEGYQFGEWRIIKKIHYYSNHPQVPLDFYKYFCDDFGELSEENYLGVTSWLKGCYIDGVAYGDTSFIVVGVSDNSFPSEFNLSQNYPNPFNPTTTINYSIKERGFVQLKVYDILGKEVATLVNEEKLRGNYSTSFDGSNLPSGVYVYSIRVNNFIQNRKMILLK